MNQPNIYTLELPLDKEVARQTKFLSFLKDLGNPIQHTFVSQYFKGRFRVAASDMLKGDGSLGRTASTKVMENVSELTISKFASKLNVAMSIDAMSRDISIRIRLAPDATPILTVEITPKDLAAQMALTNVWSVIDSSSL